MYHIKHGFASDKWCQYSCPIRCHRKVYGKMCGILKENEEMIQASINVTGVRTWAIAWV